MENNDRTHSKAVNLVLKCGIPPHLAGCEYLATTVEMIATTKCSMAAVYKILAEENDVRPKSISRDVAYAIEQGFTVREKVSELTGVEIPKQQMHPSLIVSYLAIQLRTTLDE